MKKLEKLRQTKVVKSLPVFAAMFSCGGDNKVDVHSFAKLNDIRVPTLQVYLRNSAMFKIVENNWVQYLGDDISVSAIIEQFMLSLEVNDAKQRANDAKRVELESYNVRNVHIPAKQQDLPFEETEQTMYENIMDRIELDIDRSTEQARLLTVDIENLRLEIALLHEDIKTIPNDIFNLIRRKK